MIIPITFPSAALFWMNYNPAINLNRYSVSSRELVDLPKIYDFRLSPETAQQLTGILGLPCPVTAMSPLDTIKYHNRFIQTIRRPAALPANSFIKLTDRSITGIAKDMEVYVASPELCFLQAAQAMDLHQLVIFGTDLCGIYINDPNAFYKQRSREPVVTQAQLKHFLEAAVNSYGRRDALRAVNFILDRSNSGMETMLAVLSQLFPSLGGFRVVPPELNKAISMSAEAIRLLGGKILIADMVWELLRIIIEYDSDISHLTSEQHRKDKRRASAMALSGYKTISITRSDVATLAKLDETFIRIRRLLGMPSINTKLAQYLPERKKLMHIFKTFRLDAPETYRFSGIL